MFRSNTLASMALILALGAAPALAQQAEHEQHHPGAATEVAQQGAAGGITSASGGMPMMGMMSHGMMGGGMGQMGMMSPGSGHIEGRIAFLKTELKITDAQLPLWNAVADAMRENAKTTQAMPGGMMAMMSQPAPLPDRLATREKVLTAQLDATRKLKTAVAPLYAALSDEQKKTADELTSAGSMMGGGMMGMMGGGMMGSSMQPGAAQSPMMGGEQRGGMHGQGKMGRSPRQH